MKNIEVYVTPTYKKELKRLKRKHYPIKLITKCLTAIINNDRKTLKRIKNHNLKGNWNEFNEFHPARIADLGNAKYDQWIVVYNLKHTKLTLTLATTGNHEILNKHDPNTILKTQYKLF